MSVSSFAPGFSRQGTMGIVANVLRGRSKNSPGRIGELSHSGLPHDNGVALFICDPQMDFLPEGKMPMPKAKEVSERIAQAIRDYGDSIDEIYVSLQQRPSYHIGHPTFWQNPMGKPPEDFIHIDQTDISSGAYTPAREEDSEWGSTYFSLLAKKKINNLLVFPEHCVVGTVGAAVIPTLSDAIRAWEEAKGKAIHYLPKGNCSRTEQFSCFGAVVALKEQESTKFNTPLLETLKQHSRIAICGFGLSHSVKYSVQDFLQHTSQKSCTSSMIIIPDMCSTWRDFRNSARYFLEEVATTYEHDHRVLVSSSNRLIHVFTDEVINSFEKQATLSSSFETRLPQSPAQAKHSSLKDHTNLSLFHDGYEFGGSDHRLSPADNSDLFNFRTNGTTLLGDGCFLVYDEANFGSLKLWWFKSTPGVEMSEESFETLERSVAFFIPSPRRSVPEVMFQNKGHSELVREINKSDNKHSNRKQAYIGMLRFVQECFKFQGRFIIRSGDQVDSVLHEAELYALDSVGHVVQVDASDFVSPKDFAVLSCIQKSNTAFKGTKKQSKPVFIQTGESLGATLELI